MAAGPSRTATRQSLDARARAQDRRLDPRGRRERERGERVRGRGGGRGPPRASDHEAVLVLGEPDDVPHRQQLPLALGVHDGPDDELLGGAGLAERRRGLDDARRHALREALLERVPRLEVEANGAQVRVCGAAIILHEAQRLMQLGRRRKVNHARVLRYGDGRLEEVLVEVTHRCRILRGPGLHADIAQRDNIRLHARRLATDLPEPVRPLLRRLCQDVEVCLPWIEHLHGELAAIDPRPVLLYKLQLRAAFNGCH
mmetsp:Transcript_113931/g.318291  ORF Transcript_113931/g.318291 Transcript_113931/m.318291 type:complete len:257 (-) Transcript_113931:671-1441(-)